MSFPHSRFFRPHQPLSRPSGPEKQLNADRRFPPPPGRNFSRFAGANRFWGPAKICWGEIQLLWLMGPKCLCLVRFWVEKNPRGSERSPSFITRAPSWPEAPDSYLAFPSPSRSPTAARTKPADPNAKPLKSFLTSLLGFQWVQFQGPGLFRPGRHHDL